MSWIVKVGTLSSATALTDEELKNNAKEFAIYFKSKGATLEAICGMLGNIERESQINPGLKETESTSSGWGLIQWTPSSVITNYASSKGKEWTDGELQCDKINEEESSGDWIPTSEYPYSWKEFLALTDVNEATRAYEAERERAGVVAMNDRLAYANKWFSYFSGSPLPPTPTPTPTKKKKKFPIWLMCKKRF